MPTFVLKKYDDVNEQEANNTTEENNQDTKDDDLTITVLGTVSEVVSNALNKVFKKADLKAEEVDDRDSNIKVVSTEDINKNPLEALRFVKEGDVVFIKNRGFRTTQEEWYLTNVNNKAKKVFLTEESFAEYILNYRLDKDAS